MQSAALVSQDPAPSKGPRQDCAVAPIDALYNQELSNTNTSPRPVCPVQGGVAVSDINCCPLWNPQCQPYNGVDFNSAPTLSAAPPPAVSMTEQSRLLFQKVVEEEYESIRAINIFFCKLLVAMACLIAVTVTAAAALYSAWSWLKHTEWLSCVSLTLSCVSFIAFFFVRALKTWNYVAFSGIMLGLGLFIGTKFDLPTILIGITVCICCALSAFVLLSHTDLSYVKGTGVILLLVALPFVLISCPWKQSVFFGVLVLTFSHTCVDTSNVSECFCLAVMFLADVSKMKQRTADRNGLLAAFDLFLDVTAILLFILNQFGRRRNGPVTAHITLD